MFTSVAVTRIMWVLGFPADHDYPVGSASCIGCTADPFGNKVADNKASLKDPPVVFKVVNVERELPWDEINPDNDETWSWDRRGQVLQRWRMDAPAEGGIRRIPARSWTCSLLQRATSAEPSRLCRVEAREQRPDSKVCLKPMIYVHDVGSTFGKKRRRLSRRVRNESTWKF